MTDDDLDAGFYDAEDRPQRWRVAAGSLCLSVTLTFALSPVRGLGAALFALVLWAAAYFGLGFVSLSEKLRRVRAEALVSRE